MHYLSHIPENITPSTKCIIMLHGVWSNESDLFALSKDFPGEYLIYSLRWPFILWAGRFAWYPVDFSNGKPRYQLADVDRGYTEFIACIDKIREEYNIVSENIFLMWFSQGAILSLYTFSKSPEKLGGIIVLSGRLLSEIDTSSVDISKYIGKKVFLGHGSEDTMMPISGLQVTKGYIQSLVVVPTVKMYPIGHTISHDEIQDIVEWMA